MTITLEFMMPRFVGKRFDGHTLPFEVLKNLVILEDLLIEAAKWKYLEAHPDRQRVPRGFTDGVSLQLAQVRDGSTMPVILLTLVNLASSSPNTDAQISYFEKGKAAILATVSSAEDPVAEDDSLPIHLLGYFDQLGRSLRDDEALELDPLNLQRPARLTRETRRRILLRSTQVDEIEEKIAVRGSVPEMDQEKMSFDFQVISGPRVKAPVESQHFDVVLKAFNGYRDGKNILIQGLGKYNRRDKLLRVSAVEHVSILDDMDVGARLDEFKALRQGWLGEHKGKAFDLKGLGWLTETFQQHYPDDLPFPYTYPTAEGGVQFEWSLKEKEITLEIDLETHKGEWHALDMTTEGEEVRTLNLNGVNDWQWLVGEIASQI